MRRTMAATASTLVVALLAGCGLLPNSASSDVVLRGTVLGLGARVRASSDVHALNAAAAADQIEVTVEEDPGIKTKVDDDGSFVLRGLPEDGFTVVFTLNGAVIGTQWFDEVAPNQEITIVVEIIDGEAVVTDEMRTGIGHGDIEIEGLVDAVLTLNPAGDSRFRIDGRVVIARPGTTAIREGNTARTVNDVTAGRRVHVKGEYVNGSTDILAREIKLQGPAEDEAGTGGKVTICHIPPGNPDNRRTLTIGASAWPAHQAHGDTMGPCSGGGGGGGGNNGNNGNGNNGNNGNGRGKG